MLMSLISFYTVFSIFVFVCFLLFYTDPRMRMWGKRKQFKWVLLIILISAFWLPVMFFSLLIVSLGIIRKETQ